MMFREDIGRTFEKELAMIKDERLRDMVIEAWDMAAVEGGWNSFDDLNRMPYTLLTETHGISFIDHTKAVTAGAVGLAMAQIDNYSTPYRIDMDRLVAGALLHDVGKLLEIEPDGSGGHRKSRHGMLERHPISGAIIAAKVGLPEEIVNTIACHAKEGDGRPKVIETIFIHQADFATFDPLVYLNKGDLIE